MLMCSQLDQYQRKSTDILHEEPHAVLLASRDLIRKIYDGVNTLRMGDADLRFYIATVQDG